MIRPAAALAMLLGAAPAAWAGAWPQEPGAWQIITTTTAYRVSTAGFDPQGQPTGGRRFRKIEFGPYIEYGLSPSWTLGAQPRLTLAESRAQGRTRRTGGLADSDLFLRRVIARGERDVLSLQGLVALPGGYDPDDDPSLGTGTADLELRLLYGRGFDLGGGASAFTEVQGGYRHRPGNPADQVRIDLTAGVRPVPNWLLLAQNFSQFSVRNARADGPDFDLHKLQLSVVHDLSRSLSLQIGAYREYEGRRIALGTAAFAALWIRF